MQVCKQPRERFMGMTGFILVRKQARVAQITAVFAVITTLLVGLLATPLVAFATYNQPVAPKLTAGSALLWDLDDQVALLDKNAHERRYPASMTKVMTALLALERANLTDTVTVQEGDFAELSPESSLAGLKPGDTLTVRDLLACLLLPSGNEAAYVLARHVGGDWHSFVDLMNARAAELGCEDTHFENPCGLHDSDHYTTASDLERIFAAALEHPEFGEITRQFTWDVPATSVQGAHTIKNTDALVDPKSSVFMGEAIDAGKTGYTAEAGRCFIVAAHKNGMRYIAVVMGSEGGIEASGTGPHHREAAALLNWGFTAWNRQTLIHAGDKLGHVGVRLSANGSSVDLVAAQDVVATVPAGVTFDDLTVTPGWPATLTAPVAAHADAGTAQIALADRGLGTVGVQAAEARELSISALIIDWLSDPVHCALVAGVLLLLVIVLGLLSGRRRKRRRARGLRFDAAHHRIGASRAALGTRAARSRRTSSHRLHRRR